jgi:hypothetical protein
MFVLYPDGKSDGESGAASPFYSSLSFFGRLTLYFAGIRLAYVFFGERAEQQRALSQ